MILFANETEKHDSRLFAKNFRMRLHRRLTIPLLSAIAAQIPDDIFFLKGVYEVNAFPIKLFNIAVYIMSPSLSKSVIKRLNAAIPLFFFFGFLSFVTLCSSGVIVFPPFCI